MKRTNVLWEHFHAITFKSDGNQEAIELPYVECRKYNKVLTYDSQIGGTSHIAFAMSRTFVHGRQNCCVPTTHSGSIYIVRVTYELF